MKHLLIFVCSLALAFSSSAQRVVSVPESETIANGKFIRRTDNYWKLVTISDIKTELSLGISDVSGLSAALGGKQATITLGTTAQYFRGDLSLATFPTNNTAFTNGAGYLVAADIAGKQDALSGTGFVKIVGSVISYDNSSYSLTSHNHSGVYQPLDADLTTLAALSTTTVGGNFLTLTNPSAITFLRINADNTIDALSASAFRTAIGAGTSSTAGTVTTVSVVSANGFAGSVASATTTPAITLTTTVTGILNGNGTSVSAAVAGDFPTLNQNTTGSAATLTTSRNIQGVAFNGSAAIDIINGTGFVKATGTSISYDNTTYLSTSSAASTYQPLDADLTTIAGLTPTTDNFLVSVASAWASRTPAQVKTTLSLNLVENTALSTWAGSTSITTLGTISAGTVPVGNIGSLGTGVATALGVNVGSAGAFVTFNGALGTPSSGTLTNATGLPQSGVTSLTSDLALKAPLASPTFTGTPTLPTGTVGTTQSAGNSTTALATTAFVTTADALKANLASPALTGSPTAPTQTADDNSTKIATTAYVDTKPAENVALLRSLGSTVLEEASCGPMQGISGSTGLTDAQQYIEAIYLKKAQTITGVKFRLVTSGSFTGDAENSVALYSYSAGVITRVAISSNDPNIWKQSNAGFVTAAFTGGTYSAAAGVYYIGVLYNQSAQPTQPTIANTPGTTSAAVAGDFTNSAKLVGVLNSQTAQGTPLNLSSFSTNGTRYYLALY